MPLQATSGAASYDGFGGGVAAVPQYIEDVFSTWLYTGNGATQTITNGIDLSGQGGLVWTKNRNVDGDFHSIFDTNRGALNRLVTSTTFANTSIANSLQSFNSNGFSVGSSGTVNASTYNYVSWTFRKQPKFFDIVTYTGTGSPQNIAHNLGSVPGTIIVKSTTSDSNWYVYHRSLATNQALKLNSFAATETFSGFWNNTAPTSTEFTVGTAGDTNGSGNIFVAYLFAHDAGGFGLSGNENVISCGSWEGNGSTQDISLGYEPQYILLKNTTLNYNWVISDTMRGMDNTNSNWVFANTAAAEATNTPSYLIPTATGFKVNTATPTYNASGSTYIYIAIRRGPMKTPTLGTSVFSPSTRAGTGATATVTGVGFAPDVMWCQRTDNSSGNRISSKLRGVPNQLMTFDTVAEQLFGLNSFNQNGVSIGTNANWNSATGTFRDLFFQRAPSFFDEVCYKGTGGPMTIGHNLTVVPELIINKSRSSANNWFVYKPSSSATFGYLNLTDAFSSLGDQPATATTYDPISYANGTTYVSYLFATCAGVSKVGSYTGDGTDGRIIDCGFTSGARFVLIKSTSNTGNWWVWDTARGIVSGNDPVLRLNTTAAESTNSDDLDPSSSGFIVNYNGLFAINESGWSYIFLAIA